MFFHNWAGGKPLAVDLTVSHPLRPSEPRPTPEKVRKAMATEEQLKSAKYNHSCATVGWTFKPLAIHPFAGVTPEGAQFLHRLARQFAENSTVRETRGERVSHFWVTFTMTVIKEVAAQLKLTTYTGPPGPVLPTLLSCDVYGNELLRSLGGQKLKRARPLPVANPAEPPRPDAVGSLEHEANMDPNV